MCGRMAKGLHFFGRWQFLVYLDAAEFVNISCWW